MKRIYVCLLLGLFSCVNSLNLFSIPPAEVYFGNYLLKHYYGAGSTLNWFMAEQSCHMHGGFLAMPKTESFNDAITDLAKTTEAAGWLGGMDFFYEQAWQWSDGTYFSSGYTNWRIGEPNNDKDEDCIEIYDGLWNDLSCYENRGYFCQIDCTTTTKSDFVALAFSDSFSEGSKSATSINEARTECENRGLKHTQGVKSYAATDQFKKHLLKFTGAKYCIDDENHGKMMDANGLLDQECAGQPFLYICEGYRPHYMKISDEAPVVKESGNLEVECTAAGYPIPDVLWRKNLDHVITTDTNASIHPKRSAGKSTLVNKNARQGDADRYRCWATNNINGEEHSASINSDLEVMMNLN